MVKHIYNVENRRVTVILTKPVGRVFTFTEKQIPEHLNFDDLIVQLGDINLTDEEFLTTIDEIDSFIKHGKGKVTYDEKSDSVKLGEIELSESLKRRYKVMIAAGQDVTPLDNFVENLKKNSYKDIQEELFAFMEKNDLPIIEHGCLLAYKTVGSDYLDKHTRTISNAIVAVVEMNPEDVDSNRNETCSSGLHFTSKDYASNTFYSSGDRIMILKVNPSAVMAIPRDYNDQKGRCYKYEVISELKVGEESIKSDFIAKDEDLTVKDVVEDVVEAPKKKSSGKAKKKDGSVDFLIFNQASFSEVEWELRGKTYKGYKLLEVPKGIDWTKLLENAKKTNPEMKSLFEFIYTNSVRPHRETTNTERALVMVTSEQVPGGLAKVLKKAKLLAPSLKMITK